MSKLLNLYLVVSEELEGENLYGAVLCYQICELVVARNHGQARWLAWKSDDGIDGSWSQWAPMADMPKMAVRLKAVGALPGPARVLDYAEYKGMGDDYWDVGNAPHIGIHAEEGP